MDFAAYAQALSVLEAYLARRHAGTAEPVAALLAAHGELADLLAPMLEAAPGDEATLASAAAVGTPPAWRGLPGEGETIGGYRIERLLGQGGMGVVFLATDARLSRKVALKLVRPERLGSQPARERFWREAKLAARLEHPHICAVYEVGEAQGMPFMAMRFVAGETLAARVAREASATRGTDLERRRIDEVIRIVESAARALHFAHTHGVVHRDVKPANVLIEPDGTPIVLDFGMARADEDDLGLTMTGELAGTPLYMAPEQVAAKARTVDARTDVYALGVTLYEAVTGVRPFGGQSMRELLDAITEHDPPPPSRHNRHVPHDLDVVLEKAMEKDPGRRYRTAADFADDLGRVRARAPVLARRAGPALRVRRWMQRNPVAMAFLGLAAGALAVITFLYLRGEAARREFELVSLVPRLNELRASEAQLYASWPEHGPALRAWLRRADAWHRDVSSVRRVLDRLGAAGQGGARPPSDPAQRFLFDTLRSIAADAEASLGSNGLVTRARRNLERLEQDLAGVDQHAAAWRDAITAIRKSPRYAGLEAGPQVGLVPLGPDPATGLWEFAHPATGALPEHGDSGAWRITDDTCIVFVLLPGGVFTMGAQAKTPTGSNYDPLARDDQGPPHEVALAPFFLGKYELTQGQWMRLTDGTNPADARPGSNFRIPLTLAHPVEYVSWDESRRVLEEAGLVLPTEAQWEYAARGGTSTPWWTGSDVASLNGKINLADKTAADRKAGWFEIDERVVDGFVWHAPVDTLAQNGFGLFHVCGNVWEWVRDSWTLYREHPPAAGDGLRSDAPGNRVLRGGAFDHAPVHARVAMRRSDDPTTRSGNIGLRAARVLR